MLVLKKTLEENGIYSGYDTSENFVPNGWAAIPESLIEKALPLLPFIIPIFDEYGNITDIADNAEARAAQAEADANRPAPPVDALTMTQLALTELAEAQEASQTSTEIALAELAELIAGGGN